MPFEAMVAAMALGSDAEAKKMLAALEGKFGPEGATATEWQRACEADGITRETFYRRRKELLEAGLVKKEGDGQGARYSCSRTRALA